MFKPSSQSAASPAGACSSPISTNLLKRKHLQHEAERTQQLASEDDINLEQSTEVGMLLGICIFVFACRPMLFGKSYWFALNVNGRLEMEEASLR